MDQLRVKLRQRVLEAQAHRSGTDRAVQKLQDTLPGEQQIIISDIVAGIQKLKVSRGKGLHEVIEMLQHSLRGLDLDSIQALEPIVEKIVGGTGQQTHMLFKTAREGRLPMVPSSVETVEPKIQKKKKKKKKKKTTTCDPMTGVSRPLFI
jgi:hypothetical protein